MKIVLTGGGSGGHFYPLIAVAEEIYAIARDQKLVQPELYFLSDEPYDKKALFDTDIEFRRVPAGKIRRYASPKNIVDLCKTAWGLVYALAVVFWIYPDVVFSKGGFGSFPVTVAAWVLRIPLLIHESDTVPGRANRTMAKRAARIAVSFPETARFFPADKTAWTGTPVRKSLREKLPENAHDILKLDRNIPTLLVIGGSLGAEMINNAILDSLHELIERFQVIHQTGEDNFAAVSGIASVELKDAKNKDRYRPIAFLHDEALRASAGAADIIVSRAGAGAIAEIAVWGKPSIIIPITDSNGDHQRKNAAAFAAGNACTVVEEANLKPHILVEELKRLAEDFDLRHRMSESAKKFSRPDAAEKIAHAILSIALKHE